MKKFLQNIVRLKKISTIKDFLVDTFAKRTIPRTFHAAKKYKYLLYFANNV
jgi:hypothetical protein